MKARRRITISHNGSGLRVTIVRHTDGFGLDTIIRHCYREVTRSSADRLTHFLDAAIPAYFTIEPDGLFTSFYVN